jgi:small-conductance mechanosensitive channel
VIDRLLQSSTFYGNSPASMAVAAWLWLVGVLALVIIQRVLIGWLEKRAAVTARQRDHFLAAMLRKTRFIFILFIAMGLASVALSLPPGLASIVDAIAKLALLVQIALWGGELIAVLFRRYLSRTGAETSTTAEAISYLLRLVLWVLIILVGLESFEIHVTALVAGLGIGGIAVALAVQNILGDVFAAFSILFDKPFVVGDLIEVGEYAGTVLHVGIKSTRMRSVTGEQIILANGELLKRGVRNFGVMRDRDEARSVLLSQKSWMSTPAAAEKRPPGEDPS